MARAVYPIRTRIKLMADPHSPSGPWWKELNRYHWFVFTMACLAWMFDCLDQQLFIIARNPAIADLLKSASPELQKTWGGNATAIFELGVRRMPEGANVSVAPSGMQSLA